MLELDDLNVYYGKNHVLRDLSLQIAEGEVVTLIGANAAGKTTTLRTILGLKDTASGRVRFLDADVSDLSTPERVHRGLVLVPEGRQVFTKFTVLENLLMGAYHRPDRNAAGKEVDRIFALFPRLAERRTQKAGSMSGGEQQMLAIGRGLMAKPRCLLLDEPTLGLAPILVPAQRLRGLGQGRLGTGPAGRGVEGGHETTDRPLAARTADDDLALVDLRRHRLAVTDSRVRHASIPTYFAAGGIECDQAVIQRHDIDIPIRYGHAAIDGTATDFEIA